MYIGVKQYNEKYIIKLYYIQTICNYYIRTSIFSLQNQISIKSEQTDQSKQISNGKNKIVYQHTSQDIIDEESLKQIANQLQIAYITSNVSLTHQDILSIIQKTTFKLKLTKTPSVSMLYQYIPKSSPLLHLLTKKPVRSASGVQVLAVMCQSHICPHQFKTGSACIYCGGGPDSDFNYSSQSYTGYEPTSMRAVEARYNPTQQIKTRLQQLKSLGHDSAKYEVVLMGGTFMSLSQQYREQFICQMLSSLTESPLVPLPDQVQLAASSYQKLVALTIETRPDFCQARHLTQMLRYGCTRIEVGVQSVYPDVIAAVNRGHTVRSIIRCACQSKEAGYKIISHLMPNLVRTDLIRDINGAKQALLDCRFKFDGVKIYPTLVLRGTKLYEMWLQGKYQKEINHLNLINLLANFMILAPPYLRCYRLMRDIPLPLVTSGVEAANLRELALEEVKKRNKVSLEIRQREVGIQGLEENMDDDEQSVNNDDDAQSAIEITRRDYYACGGWETFLSIEQPSKTPGKPQVLLGLLRLRQGVLGRRKSASIRPELQCRVSIIREVHVYGTAIGVADKGISEQHKGLGKLLLYEAEKIAKREHRSKKISVISGLGTREYYAKYGYQLDGVYMSKLL